MTPGSMYTDFTHMYNFVDIRTKKPTEQLTTIKIKTEQNTVYENIRTNPDNKYFTYMCNLANMNYILDSWDTHTVLVPSDTSLKSKGVTDAIFINMDKNTAKQIISYCIINNNIDKSIFQYSPIISFSTLNKTSQLIIINKDNKTIINNVIEILEFDIKCSNGIIHIINDIPTPYII